MALRELLGRYVALEEYYLDETAGMAIRIDEVVSAVGEGRGWGGRGQASRVSPYPPARGLRAADGEAYGWGQGWPDGGGGRARVEAAASRAKVHSCPEGVCLRKLGRQDGLGQDGWVESPHWVVWVCRPQG